MPLLEIQNLSKEVDNQTILSQLSLSVVEGEFFSLLGPSGCGKTTLLRLLAGLECPSSGEIRLDGVRIDQLSPQKRPVNMVFQKYALFPHLSVMDNVAFGLKLKKTPPNEIRERCEEALSMVGLKNLSQRMPETLSGGQAQRVAVARAIVNRPKLLLLDEPLSALDQKMREHLQTELRTLQRRLGLTFIYVTHDQEEAMILSDRICVMNEGRIEQVATPRDLYDHPASFFVASFVGQMTRLTGKVVSTDGLKNEILLSSGAKIQAIKTKEFPLKESAVAFVRPEKMQLYGLNESVPTGQNVLEGKVFQVIFRGDQTVTEVDCGGFLVQSIMMSKEHQWKINDLVRVVFEQNETWLFDEAFS